MRSCSEISTNIKISKTLFKHFDKFSYELFNETYYYEYLNSLIEQKLIEENYMNNSIISTEEINKYNIRRADKLDNTYYECLVLTTTKEINFDISINMNKTK